jgi:hypothetical protein
VVVVRTGDAQREFTVDATTKPISLEADFAKP